MLIEYFGYLKRDIDHTCFDFRVNIRANGLGSYSGIVCSFTTSAEYQQRFSKMVTHTATSSAGQNSSTVTGV